MSRCGRCVAILGISVLALVFPVVAQEEGRADPQAIAESLHVTDFSSQQLQLPDDRPAEIEVPIDFDGAPGALRLRPHSVRSEIFQVRVQGADGEIRDIEAPPPTTWRGEVVGDDGSRVAASIYDGQLRASIVRGDGSLWHVQPVSDAEAAADRSMHAVYRDVDVALPDNVTLTVQVEDAPPSETAGGPGGITFDTVEIAFDVDFEYYTLRLNDTDMIMVDIETLMNAMELIYEVYVNITYSITTTIIRTAEPDPYTVTDAFALLTEFQNEWNLNQGAVVRDLAHLLTGKNLDGSIIGVAFIGVVCTVPGFSYALSQSLFTQNLAGRVALTGQEIGHNWNAVHCDGDPDCAILCATVGGCPGGLLSLGARSRAAIGAWRDMTACTSVVPGSLNNVVWRHDETGHNSVWALNNLEVPNWSQLPSVPDTDWEIVGTGDFNGDQNPDILWRHRIDGRNAIWALRATSVQGWGELPQVPDPNWMVVGTGDFNCDGKWDILWRHQGSGANNIWFLDGANYVGGGPLPPVMDLNWEVVGTGDFNGDGKCDILWRHMLTGATAVWLLNGLSVLSSGNTSQLQSNLSWTVVGVGDFNGDGNADILWRNIDDGRNYVWFVAGLTVIGGGDLPTAPDQHWTIVGVGTFDDDIMSDIFWRNVFNGKNAVWFVVGHSVPSWGLLPQIHDNMWCSHIGSVN